MKYGRRLIILLMLLLAVAIPARAAEQVALPDVKDFTAASFELAVILNGQLLGAGRGEIENPTRAYLTLKLLPLFPGDTTETQEIVIYDDRSYYRYNDETQWYYEDYGGSPSEDVLL